MSEIYGVLPHERLYKFQISLAKCNDLACECCLDGRKEPSGKAQRRQCCHALQSATKQEFPNGHAAPAGFSSFCWQEEECDPDFLDKVVIWMSSSAHAGGRDADARAHLAGAAQRVSQPLPALGGQLRNVVKPQGAGVGCSEEGHSGLDQRWLAQGDCGIGYSCAQHAGQPGWQYLQGIELRSTALLGAHADTGTKANMEV